jgi:hypothetical protein
MKSGSSNVSTAYLAGIRSRDELKTSRLGPSRDHATVVCETFHTVSEEAFSEVHIQHPAYLHPYESGGWPIAPTSAARGPQDLGDWIVMRPGATSKIENGLRSASTLY